MTWAVEAEPGDRPPERDKRRGNADSSAWTSRCCPHLGDNRARLGPRRHTAARGCQPGSDAEPRIDAAGASAAGAAAPSTKIAAGSQRGAPRRARLSLVALHGLSEA